MIYKEFVGKWHSINENFQRVDNSHPLEFYLSKTNKNQSKLLFLAGKNNIKISDSEFIKVEVGLRKDGRYAYKFILTDPRFESQFYRLCYDLVDSSRGCLKSEESYKFIINLFLKWQRMMKISKNNILSEEKIKGLIAELIVLEKFIKSKIDKNLVINAWQGPEEGYQDFIFDNFWGEIKSITKRGEKITISSIEQLDTEINGNIYTVMLDKVDILNKRCITLNAIIKRIENLLGDNILLLDIFKDKLTKVGYLYSEEYDKFIYHVSKISSYEVNDSFPRIRRSQIPIEISKVKYEILLATISKWLVEEFEWS